MRLQALSPTVLRRVLVLGVVVLLIGGAVAIYALATPGDNQPVTRSGMDTATTDESVVVIAPDIPETAPREDLAVATTVPSEFATQVAHALFTWDTASLVMRTDLVEALVAVADPTGESSPGLVSDVDNYLPSASMWVQLAQYETRQWLVVESTETPEEWAVAQAQAGDQLAPGTTAVTVRGVRHRDGLWEDEPVSSTHEVAFTVFMVCGPSYKRCHLLRLSIPNRPLE